MVQILKEMSQDEPTEKIFIYLTFFKQINLMNYADPSDDVCVLPGRYRSFEKINPHARLRPSKMNWVTFHVQNKEVGAAKAYFENHSKLTQSDCVLEEIHELSVEVPTFPQNEKKT